MFACYNVTTMIINRSPSTTSTPIPGINPSPGKSGAGTSIEYGQIAQWHLFGKTPGNLPAPKKKAVIAPKTRLKLELLGVFSDMKTGDGWAIISEKGGNHKIYRIGAELPGNAILQSVESNRVTLERNGRYESLPLKKPSSPGAANSTAGNNVLRAMRPPPSTKIRARRVGKSKLM